MDAAFMEFPAILRKLAGAKPAKRIGAPSGSNCKSKCCNGPNTASCSKLYKAPLVQSVGTTSERAPKGGLCCKSQMLAFKPFA